MSKTWRIKPKVNQELIDQFPEINPIVLQLLFSRGLIEQKAIDDFLNPNYDCQILDPFLFSEMEKAVERFLSAIARKEKIMVYGDYDADGVCATAVMFETLKSLGQDAEIYIPFRESEGYGLNTKVVQQIIEQGFNLVVTVDCGVSNVQEIKTLKEAGIDVVVLDHHQEPIELPPALAIINPSLKDSGYPFKNLSGAGVAFKFVQAVMSVGERQNFPLKLPAGFDKWLLDLVAISTIGDIVSLLGENRILTKYGLMVLEKTKRIGLKKLIENINNFSGVIDAEYVGWRLVPRLNAAGRIDHASLAFYLLTAKTEEEAEKMAETLEKNNQERQQITDKILKEAEIQIGEVKEEIKILWVVGDGWPVGVVGLVAGRLCDRYHRPALVVTRDGDPKVSDGASKFVGSGRSIDEFNITDGLKECEKFLARFGGHSQACGFTALGEDNFKNFKDKLTEIAEKKLKNIDLTPILVVETEIELKDINWELLADLEKFEPFGEDNPKPLFAAFGLRVEQIQTVGSDGKHLRILASQAEHPNIHKFIGFSFGEWRARLKAGDKIDIIFELGVNEWNGSRELQLKIVDIRKMC
ncbi:MAG: single-stranded-DNA-specific exonuclease RecJ [Patescibacteria group bacterium]